MAGWIKFALEVKVYLDAVHVLVYNILEVQVYLMNNTRKKKLHDQEDMEEMKYGWVELICVRSEVKVDS